MHAISQCNSIAIITCLKNSILDVHGSYLECHQTPRPNFYQPSSCIALVYQSVLLSYDNRSTLIRLDRRKKNWSRLSFYNTITYCHKVTYYMQIVMSWLLRTIEKRPSLSILDQIFSCDPTVLESICYRARAKRLINDSKTTGGLRKIWTGC